MGYFGGPNKALANPCFKRPNLVSNGREPVERERGEQRREEEEEEEEEDGDQASQGMDACLCYEFYIDIRDPSMILIQEFLGYDC